MTTLDSRAQAKSRIGGYLATLDVMLYYLSLECPSILGEASLEIRGKQFQGDLRRCHPGDTCGGRKASERWAPEETDLTGRIWQESGISHLSSPLLE